MDDPRTGPATTPDAGAPSASSETSPDGLTTAVQVDTAALREVREFLGTRLEAARRGVDPVGVAALVQDLETAFEELSVAEEEVRAQQAQIAGLLSDRQARLWQQDRMLSIMPVPVLATDSRGVVRTVNPAAARVLDMQVRHVLGKPVLALFDATGRPALRRHVSARDPEGFRARARLLRRGGAALEVDLTVTPGLRDSVGTELDTWLLMPTAAASVDGLPALGSAAARLPRALVDLARLSTESLTVQELLTGVLRVCSSALRADGVHLSVNLGSPLEPLATSASSLTGQLLDGAQLMAAQGPCASAFEDGATVLTDDLRTDPRWPRLAPHVPEGVVGVVSVPLEVGDRLVGALNVYCLGPTWHDDVLESVELLGATVAAVLYERTVHAELEGLAADMTRALTSRAVIDQAKGMIMAEHGIDADEAFARLAVQSSRAGLKVREVARRMVERAHAIDDPAAS